MADYDWFHKPPNKHKIKAGEMRPLGFHAVFKYDSTYNVNGIKYYLCSRGCGTVVWDTEAHIKNVCTEFNPEVGI